VIKKIDWYIIKMYLTTFFFTMLMVSMVSIVIHYFENIDKFLRAEVTITEALSGFYIHFIPWINGLLAPIFALIAVIFFTSRLAQNSEIVAILAAGVSYNRLMRPFFIVGTFLALLLWYGNNYLIPNSTRLKNEFENERIKRNLVQTSTSDIHFMVGPDEKAYFRYYNNRDSSARNLRLEKFEGRQLISLIKAETVKFIEEPNLWQIENLEYWTFDGKDESLTIVKGIKIDTILPFHPADFSRYTKQMEMMTSSDLREFIAVEKRKGISTAKSYLIELYRRTSDPFTMIILTMIGVTVASRKVRGGIGLHLAAGVIIGSCFVILSKFSVTFASNLNLNPLLGVWIPNIIFSFVALYLYLKAQK
jgi:lipopolysaccharide export system permease protein